MATEENGPPQRPLRTDELARCARRLTGQGVERRYWYVLCRDRSVHGKDFYYLKTHVETWRAGQLATEDFTISPLVAGGGEEEALCLFERIAGSRLPVAPVHLGDVLRDLTLLARETGPSSRSWRVVRGGADGSQPDAGPHGAAGASPPE
ncbi:MAG TPA: hypothetical protein VIK92_06785 [Thermaerobacter sp.]